MLHHHHLRLVPVPYSKVHTAQFPKIAVAFLSPFLCQTRVQHVTCSALAFLSSHFLLGVQDSQVR